MSTRQSAAGGTPRRSSTPRRRTFQACLPCKQQKVRCELGSPDDPEPPCRRCRRARLHCDFPPPRTARTRRFRLAQSARPEPPPASAVADTQQEAGPSVPPTEPAPPDYQTLVSASSILNISDALNHILDAGQQDSAAGATAPSHHTRHCSPAWSAYPLCKEGWITPAEAEFLLNHFFRCMHPFFPIMDERQCRPGDYREFPVQEPLLCTAILAVTSRYAWLGAKPSSPRAYELHSLLVKQVQSNVHNRVWGFDGSCGSERTTLAIIESILLFVEWRPRPLDIFPNPGMMPGSLNLLSSDSSCHPNCTRDACSSAINRKAHGYALTHRINTVHWHLLGIAMNLADEIGLAESLSKSKDGAADGSANAARRSRVRSFLLPTLWEVSFRLGRSSLLKLPSTSPNEEVDASSENSALIASRMELLRLSKLIENSFYASASATKGVVASGRYCDMVRSFSDMLSRWRDGLDSINGPTLFRHSILIQYHSVRLFLNAIAFQALAERLRKSANGPPDLTAEAQIRRAVVSEESTDDIRMIQEIATESKRALELTLDLDQAGLLMHVPFTVMTYVGTATVFLLKVLGLGIAPGHDSAGLLVRLCKALKEAVVDEAHPSAGYMSKLSILVQKASAGVPQSGEYPHAGDPKDSGSLLTPSLGGDCPPVNVPPNLDSRQTLALDPSATNAFVDWSIPGDDSEASTDWLAFQLDPFLMALDGTFRLSSNSIPDTVVPGVS